VYSRIYDSQKYDPAAPVIDIAVSRVTSGDSEISLHVLVDSGADVTVLPIDILESVGARYLDVKQMRGITGHVLAVDIYLVTLRIGSHVLPGVEAAAMREGAEAILGRDVLNQLEVRLNGPAQETWIV
jgi:predicted aspartyl protease